MTLFQISPLFVWTAPCRRPTRKSLKRRRICSLVRRILPPRASPPAQSPRRRAIGSEPRSPTRARSTPAAAATSSSWRPYPLLKEKSRNGASSRELLQTRDGNVLLLSETPASPGEHGVDVQALKTALEQARSDEVFSRLSARRRRATSLNRRRRARTTRRCRLVPEM